MIVIDRKVPWMLELAWLVASLAELGHERAAAITREYLHSMVASITDEQETSMMVEHQARRAVELAISLAMFLGANRELDSSITIKSIVSHLFKIYLSLPRNDKEIFSTSTNLSSQPRDRDARSDNETTNEGKNSTTNKLSLTTTLTHEPDHGPQANLSISHFVLIDVTLCLKISCSSMCASVTERSRRQS